jgi:predicted permease
MAAWSGNVRLASRTLRKAPAFTLTTVILLGLGVGSVTTIFTLVDHVLLRDLPYPAQDRLVVVENGSHSGPVWWELQNLNSVELWGAAWPGTANLVGEGDPLRVTEAKVSEDFFTLFGALPALGRLLVEDDFQAANAVVMSHGVWERAFGSDPGVLGRMIQIDDRSHEVVGVLDREFVAPEWIVQAGRSLDFWRPMDWNEDGLERASMWVLDVIGRMAPGVTLEDVNAELTRASEILGEAWPEDRVDREGNPVDLPAAPLQEVTTRRVRAGLGLLLGAVGLLFLVACMNVAHLFLARGLGRVRDMAVRRALGAGTGSLVQQLLVESLVLGAAGGALGVGLAALGLKSFLSLNPSAIPWGGDISLDLRTLSFAVAISGLTILLFGLVPALRSMGRDLTDSLKGASRGATVGRGVSRLRGGLVVAEVALSLVLVAGAGLLLKSFMNVQALGPGFEVAGLWTVPLTPTGDILDAPENYVRSMDEVEASLARIPGVASVAYSLTLPFEMTGSGRCCWITSGLSVDGEEREDQRLILQPVSDSYFEALGMPLLAGRVWTEAEGAGDAEPWPTVINEGLAVQLFGSAQRAVNQIITVGRGEPTQTLVTGVASDTRHFGLDQDPPTFIYLPMQKLPFHIPRAHMAIRTAGETPAGWARMLREAVWAATPDIPVPTIRSMEEWVELSTSGRRFDSALFATFGGMALFLAGAGLYGTLLYTVGQRRRELGIRMALGAARKRVQRQVVSQGIVLTVLGCVVGLGGAWGLGRFLESRLYELNARDPATLVGAVAVLLLAAGLASWFPARRASRVDPIEVLREE